MASSLSNLLLFGKQCGKFSLLPWRQMSVALYSKQMNNIKPKTGILMLNMGGPASTEQVHEYLFRIMTDRDMIQLPFQSQLGPWIAKRRTPEVQKKYAEIGGGSPILKWTNIQGELLCKQLDKVSPETAPHKHYVAFRYANPLTEDSLKKLEEDNVQHTVIFSQYPQYSCATSGSSFNAIYKYYKNRQLPNNMKWSIIDRWATHPLFVKTIAERIKEELIKFPSNIRDDVIILFSAHSLPLKVVNRGDPYPSEVGATVALVMQELNVCNPYNLVWQSKFFKFAVAKQSVQGGPIRITILNISEIMEVREKSLVSEKLFSYFQVPLFRKYSKWLFLLVHLVYTAVKKYYEYTNTYPFSIPSVGPLPWLAPFTDKALKAYVKQGKKHFILVPVAFVNEHIETLHEMDIEYCKELAEKLGIEPIGRAAAPNDHPVFIDALTDLVVSHLKSNRPISPKFLTRCPHCINENCLRSKNWYAEICKQ